MALRGGIVAPINKGRLEAELGIRFRAFGTGWRYDWQSDGILARVVRPDGKEVSFAYDALGRRIRKTYAGTTTHFVWDGNVPLHEWTEEAEDSMVTWLFEQGTFVPAAKLVANGDSFSIVSDYLGTPMQAYDKAGNKVWEQELDIYGRQRKRPSAFIPFKYQGQYEDAETGLYYNRFRYYDPSTGGYISQDPIGLAGNNPTLYGYGYVFDSNIEIDPFGLDCKAQSNIYKGVQEASQILKERGLPRQVRKNILQSFDVRTIKVRLARTNEYGIRFHDKGLKVTANGRYLFETFPASRNSLAIKPEWNNMTDIKQWQIKKGTLLFEGVAALQGNLSGGQIQKFVVDDPVTSLI